MAVIYAKHVQQALDCQSQTPGAFGVKKINWTPNSGGDLGHSL